MDWSRARERIQSALGIQGGLEEEAICGVIRFMGIRSTLKRSDVNSDGGLVDGEYQFSLLCRSSQFSDGVPPPRRSIVSVGGYNYRVLSTESDGLGAMVRINLGSLQQ